MIMILTIVYTHLFFFCVDWGRSCLVKICFWSCWTLLSPFYNEWNKIRIF